MKARVLRSALDLADDFHRVAFGFRRLLASRFPYAAHNPVPGGEAVGFRVWTAAVTPKSFEKRSRKEAGSEDRPSCLRDELFRG